MRVGREYDDVGVGQRLAVGDVAGPVAQLRLERRVLEVDDVISAGDVTLRVVRAPGRRADAVGYRIEGTDIVLGGERPD